MFKKTQNSNFIIFPLVKKINLSIINSLEVGGDEESFIYKEIIQFSCDFSNYLFSKNLNNNV